MIFARFFCCQTPPLTITRIPLFLAGLYPVLSYAKSSVRPAVLDLYEAFLVPLGGRLRPSLCAFLSGTLPAVEETSDHFTR